MTQKQLPEYYQREKGPTVGCADVTIVSVAAITAFIILILILSRADFSSVIESFGNGGAAGASTPHATITTNKSAANLAAVTQGPTLAPTYTPVPTATPNTKKVKLITTCNLRPEPSVNRGTLGEFGSGTPFIFLGNRKEAEGIKWVNVELDDGSKNQGWMWDTCFNLTT